MITSKIKELFGVSFWDTIYKNIIYHDFLVTLSPFIQKRRINRLRKTQQNLISQYREKRKLTVVFFLQNESIWKYDTLYRLMEKSDFFEPKVVISPYNVHLIYDKNECLSVMQKAVSFAKEKEYDYLCAYDFNNKKWLNVKKILNPDIVFFSKPYKDTLPKYHIYNFQDKLSLYVPYGFLCIDIFRINYNLPFHNFLWKFLVETKFQKEYSEQYSLCKGDNVKVIGCLAVEKLMDDAFKPKDVWKPQTKPKKRIIWAPHHTVDYLFNFSNFLTYCDLMLDLAKEYEDDIQIAFKPHPVLKFKLINIWGKEKTEEYYNKWETMSNTQLEQGYYLDLFQTSDALIHDCASFTAEYLYTKKPTLFTLRDSQVLSHWNSFGKKCYDMHYHAESFEQIRDFIKQVVINGEDKMYDKRMEFYNTFLYPKDGVLPSQKIMNYLTEELSK